MLMVIALTAPIAHAATGDTTDYAPAGIDRIVSVSPNGSMVAALGAEGRDQLCFATIPDGDIISCSDLDAQNLDLDQASIDWSPDGKSIVFASNIFRYFRDGDLYQVDIASGEVTTLTDDGYEGNIPIGSDDPDLPDEPMLLDILPRYSPDGSQLAFSRTIWDKKDSGSTPSELWVLDLQSGEARKIARVSPGVPGALYFNLDWAPDGGTIYATVGYPDPDEADNGIWAFDLATNESTQLAGADPDLEGAYPAVMDISPRGDLMTVYFPLLLGQYALQKSGFGLLNLETGEITMIEAPAEFTAGEIEAQPLAPGFTPDGSSLLYLAFGIASPNSAGLVLRNLDTGDEQIISLADDARPTVNDYSNHLVLGQDGTVLVMSSLNTGWLIEIDDAALLEAPEVTPAATPETLPSPAADLLDITGSYVPVYAAPATNAPIVFVFSTGDQAEQIGDPVEIDGTTWVPVRDPASGTIGYITADSIAD
jgi:hypothetical protein